MKIIKNHIIQSKRNKPILLDFYFKEDGQQKPIVIFAHGYKGFKDWGCWDLIAKHFAKNGFFFIKFNFSHNGGTVAQPIDFPDLEAFGNNNFTKELDDLTSVIDFVLTQSRYQHEIDPNKLTLIGHSRGGGIVTIKASEDTRITKIISWAGVSDYASRFPTGDALEFWRKKGVSYIENSRTKQQMPHYFQFYEDFIANKKRLHIESATKKLKIPHLIIHGNSDTTVPITEAENLHRWNPKSELYIINEADHTFGGKHPWSKDKLTKHLQNVVEKSIDFI